MAKSSKKVASKSENPPVRRIGYARVSTADQNPDMQIAALEAYGVPRDLIFVDRASESMCVTAWLGDKCLETVGDVRAALGSVVINDEDLLRQSVAEKGFDLEELCLCVIEHEATAVAVGMRWVQPAFDGGDPMCGRFEPCS